jgi:molybdopterin molybdotransferase
VRLADEPGGLVARATGEQGSGILTSMLRADGLAVLPPDAHLEPGQPVEVILLRSEALPTPGAG